MNLTESQYVCTILDPLPISGFKTQQTEQNCGKKYFEYNLDQTKQKKVDLKKIHECKFANLTK